MKLFLDYLKSQSVILFGYLLVCIVFITISVLTTIAIEYVFLGIEILGFILFIYLIVHWFQYQKLSDVKDVNEKLLNENKNLKSEMLNQKDDLNAYFLMWLHQIKTPMTVSKLLLEKPDETTNTKLKMQLMYIEQYINMAMNYLKMIDHSTDMDITQVNLDDIIKNLLKKYSLLFIHNHISLEYQSNVTHVISDSQWLTILIEQILSNALKYTENGKIAIQYLEDKHALEIRDTGIGIRSEDIPKIFDRGYSGFNGRMNEKSSGLGLYLAKKISERLNIQIEVESKLSQGSIFRLVFPTNLTKM
ncbi:MAG: sensor histidine kinase [Solobacterium sp.]|uniref:sensor histidine kinase n=1 Tax=Solobacterium sp. TaxID=2060878 RepID=UPI001CB117DC|nr:sensor histidine kinase [Solobacterium sp.]MBF1077945.1 sensor histidine kinase [Solobacterium sp.]MBF1089766.1 sensor histidine kinase [Solobacterium sp.]